MGDRAVTEQGSQRTAKGERGTELDLQAAVEKGREAAATFTALDDAEVAIILRAALPHILTALEQAAEAQAKQWEERFGQPPIRFPYITEWLRAEAKKAARG